MNARLHSSLALLAIAALLGAGCDDDPGLLRPDSGPRVDAGPAPTYWADVAPLVRRECLGCHAEGGIGPFRLDTSDALREEIDAIVAAVESGYMPPWMPDDSCRQFDHVRGLGEAERATFRRWMETGMQEGDEADLPPGPEPPPPFEGTHVARMTEAYVPDAASPDDYRCFVLDHTFDADTFLTARNVVPGRPELVHHVLVYGVRPDLLAQVEAADEADPGPGYTCFGGPLAGASTGDDTSTLGVIGLGGWVPGQLPYRQNEGAAIYVPAGSRIVMQVHYNLLGAEPAADETEYHMVLTSEPPERLVTTDPLAILDLDIPAGEPIARNQRTFRNYRSEPMVVTGLTPHMHLLGTRLRAEIVPALDATAEPACLVDVPDWDFNWQQSYRVRADDALEIAPGEGVELTCVYDNSPTHQPTINGEQLDPRDVTWGEGTLDEMCLLYVEQEKPWTGPPAVGCAATADCLDGCADGDTACLLRCEGLDGACRACLLRGTLGCAQSECLAAYAPAAACIESCILSYALLGGSYERCLQAECRGGAAQAVIDCVSGVVDAGACDAELTGCGVTR
ncbi:MAG: hypothetical protein SangKO_088830 [Sandaracinaceae bacterium]